MAFRWIGRINSSIQSTRRVRSGQSCGLPSGCAIMRCITTFREFRITIWQKRTGDSCVHCLRMRPIAKRSAPDFGERSANSTRADAAPGFNRFNIDETERQRRLG